MIEREESRPSVLEHEARRLRFARTTLRNNLKGLSTAIAVFSLVSLFCVFFYIFSPTWLSVRTDAGTSQCWRGDGLLQSNVHWGHGSECEKFEKSESSSFCDYESTPGICQATQTAIVYCICNVVIISGILVMHLLSDHPKVQDAISLFMFLTLASALLGAGTIYVVFRSPLYSSEYLADLSIGDDGIKHYGPGFHGFASCSFDPPFARISTLFKSAVLRCAFPGPAALLAIIQVLSSMVAFSFSCLYYYYKRQYEYVLVAWNLHAFRNPQVEYYSIFGEFERRFGHRKHVHRFALISFIPSALVALQGSTLLAYLFNGLSIVSEIVVWFEKAKGHSREVFKDELNVFNFSPLTATGFFWQAGSKGIAIATFATITILPLVKLLVWSYFFFAPSRPSVRARALFIADASGKFQLMNLYILTLFTAGMMFNHSFRIPSYQSPFKLDSAFDRLFPDNVDATSTHIRVDVRTAMSPGVGSWMYETTFITAIAIGQIIISANLAAAQWHEKAKKRATGLSTQLEQVENDVGGDDRLYRAERRYQRYRWTDDESPDAVINVIPRLNPVPKLSSASSSLSPWSPPPPSTGRSVTFTLTEDDIIESQIPPVAVGAQDAFDTSFLNARRSDLSRRSSVTSIHPHVMALSDRTLYPQKGLRLKFTSRGKVVVLALLVTSCALLLLCQFLDTFTVEVSGMFRFLKPASKDESLASVFASLCGANGQSKMIDVAVLLLFTTCVAPMVRVFGIMVLWLVPLTLHGKRVLLHILEIISAWASLDVYLLSLVLLFFGMEGTTRKLIADAIPEMSKFMHIWFPKSISDLSASIHPSAGGFAILVIAVVLDKLAAHVVFEQAVASIAERIADETVNEAFLAVASTGDDEESYDPSTGLLTSPTLSPRAVRLPSEEEIIDTAESILETDAVMHFGPVERYISSLMPSKMYAGFPRRFWSTLAKKIGLVDEADKVDVFVRNGAETVLPG